MWHEKTLGVWSNLVHNSVVLLQHELELIVVQLELVFLEKYNFSALWNVNSNSGDALGLSDESQNLLIKIDVKLVVLWMSNDKSSLKTSLSVFNFLDPLFSPEVFE